MNRLPVKRLRRRFGLTETQARLIAELVYGGRRQSDLIKLENQRCKWSVLVRKGAGVGAQAAWLSLGGCPSQVTAMRVYMALKARKEG